MSVVVILTALSLDADLVLVTINVFARIDAFTGFTAVRVENVAVFAFLVTVLGLALVNLNGTCNTVTTDLFIQMAVRIAVFELCM